MEVKKYNIVWVLALLVAFSSCQKEPLESDSENESTNTPVPAENRILYTSNASGTFQIWQRDGESSVELTDISGQDAWWPKHNAILDQILFYTSENGRDVNDYANASLNVMLTNGRNVKTLIKSGEFGWTQHGLANWSPNGDMMILSAVDSVIGTWQLYLFDPSSKTQERLSQRSSVDYLDPIYAPNGQFVYCISVPEGESNVESNYEVIRVSIADGSELRITNNAQRDQHPAVSPDGSRIAFESLSDEAYLSIGKWVIKEIDLQSAEETVLLEDEHINLFPAYSLEGDNVYFTRLDVESFAMTLGVLERATSESMLLLDDEAHSMNPHPF